MDIAAALRKGPQHPVRHLAAEVQARRGRADHQARQPLDIPRVRHGQGEGLHKRGQAQHGGVGERRAGPRSRRCVIEHLSHVNQDEAIATIKRMKRRKALRTVRSVNRLARRWHPKGTDFNQLTRRQIRQLAGSSKTGLTQSTGNHSTERPHMLTIHVWPKRLKEFFLPHPLYKSPAVQASRGGEAARSEVFAASRTPARASPSATRCARGI